jgi:peptide/nickel transport system permease protein
MIEYIARRILAFIPTLLVVSLLVFFMIDLIPGDPVSQLLGVEASGEAINNKRIELGLDRPLGQRMVDWYSSALGGDLGDSYFLMQSVTDAILERLPISLSLGGFGLVIALVVGMSAGIAAAIQRASAVDWIVMALATVGLSVPSFWLGLNMIFFFAVKLRWLPVGGYVSFTEDPVSFLRHLIMPGLSLGILFAAMIARMTRASMLEVLQSEYVRTARAKGLHERAVVIRHALRNALIPIITVTGIAVGGLIAGGVVIETVYNIPGLGRLIVEAVKRRDYPVIQGGILVLTLGYLVINLLVDILYVWANPQIRYD